MEPPFWGVWRERLGPAPYVASSMPRRANGKRNWFKARTYLAGTCVYANRRTSAPNPAALKLHPRKPVRQSALLLLQRIDRGRTGAPKELRPTAFEESARGTVHRNHRRHFRFSREPIESRALTASGDRGCWTVISRSALDWTRSSRSAT